MSNPYKIVLALGLAAVAAACSVPEKEVVVVEPVHQERPTTKY